MRPSKTDYYLELAKVTSKRSPCLRKQYGAVLVKNDQVLEVSRTALSVQKYLVIKIC